ncbi:MAG: hypothetical protein ACKO3S_08755 [bacterium]
MRQQRLILVLNEVGAVLHRSLDVASAQRWVESQLRHGRLRAQRVRIVAA